MSATLSKLRISWVGRALLAYAVSALALVVLSLAAPGSAVFFPLVSLWCNLALFGLVLDTEAAEWGGAHKGRRKLHFHTTDGGVYGRDYTLTVDLPAMGSFLLRLTPEAPNPDAARISANKAMAQKRRTARAKNSSK